MGYLRILAAIMSMTLLCVGNAAAQPTDLVTTHGRHFAYGGETFRFVGVNIRGLVHYGQASPLPFTNTGHVDTNLDGVQAMGGKVIRVFAANQAYTNADNIARLNTVLDKMETRGLKAIVCLTDLYTTTFNPPGDDVYYMAQPGGFTLLDDTWFDGGYQNNYLPWVQDVVTALKDHNAVFAWELGNELTDIKNPLNIIPFTADVAAAIKAIDPHHMVTTGYISIDHTQIGIENGVAMYRDPNIDFITVHSYNGDVPQQNWEVVARVEKPLVLEEFGWNTGAGRDTQIAAQLDYWYDTRLVSGFMQWGYQANSFDIGDGDNIVGMDQYAHSDYAQLFALYQTRANALAAAAEDLPRIDDPSGDNIALGATVDTRSDFNASFDGTKAIDGQLSTKWTSTGSAPPHWIALDLGSDEPISGYVVKMASEGGETRQYGFREFEIQAAPSIDGPWTDRVTASNPAQYGIQRIYETPGFTTQFVRLYITDTGVDNYARLPEFAVYQAPMLGADSWNLY